MQIENNRLDLVFSTSNRVGLFEDTIKTLVAKNPDLESIVKTVWILDDRTNFSDRSVIELLVDKYFPNKGRMITFNDSRDKYSYVNKFSMLNWIAQESEYLLFIEEDWRSLGSMNISSHIQYLDGNQGVDQIVFSEHFFLQDEDFKGAYSLDDTYFKPTDSLRHTYGFVEEDNQTMFIWMSCKPMFTFNPSLIRSEVFSRAKFNALQNWEWEFHEAVNANQIYSKEGYFVHTGQFKSAEGKTWG